MNSTIQKRYCTFSLCRFHPYLASYQQLHEFVPDQHSISLIIAVCQCMRARGDLSTPFPILQSLITSGCLASELVVEYTLLLYQKDLGDLLYSFIHSYPSSLTHHPEYCYMLGVYTLLKKDFFESLQHFNLALMKRPRFWEAWMGIGLARSFLVGFIGESKNRRNMRWQSVRSRLPVSAVRRTIRFAITL